MATQLTKAQWADWYMTLDMGQQGNANNLKALAVQAKGLLSGQPVAQRTDASYLKAFNLLAFAELMSSADFDALVTYDPKADRQQNPGAATMAQRVAHDIIERGHKRVRSL